MATINGLTKEAMEAIRDGAYVSVEIVDGHLIFTKFDGTQVDSGQVQGEQGIQGIQGPPGADGTTPVNPPGVIMPYAGLVAPSGHLLCNGAAISRVTYADLFNIVGVIYGPGDGSTTFNIPNLKGRFPVGMDSAQTEFDSLGKAGGEKTVTLTPAQVANHKHSFQGTLQSTGSAQYAFLAAMNDSAAAIAVESGTNIPSNLVGGVGGSGGGGAHNNLPPYMALNYIIKT